MASPEPTPELHIAHLDGPFQVDEVTLNMDDGTRLSIQICNVCKIMGATCLHAQTREVDGETVCAFCGLDRT